MALMPLEVYSATKPASPMRAWISAFGLLLGATTLAWSMASDRIDRYLGAVESPDGWGIAYRLPKGFKKLDMKRFPSGVVRRYEGGQGVSRLIFSVWRFESGKTLTPERACDLVLRYNSDSALHALFAKQSVARGAVIDGLSAVEVESPAMALVVRAAAVNGTVVAFALNGLDPSVVRRGYGVFDFSCRTVELTGE